MKEYKINNLDQLAELYEKGKINTRALFDIIKASKIPLITFTYCPINSEKKEFKENILNGFRKYIECTKLKIERPLFLCGEKNFIDIYKECSE